MFGIPAAGTIAALIFYCIKSLRPLALFVFLIPLSGSYAAIVGFWSFAVGLEGLGISDSAAGIGGLIGLFVCGLGGAWGAYKFIHSRKKIGVQ